MLVDLCKCGDSDVIESASAALANLASMYEPNAIQIGRAGGVEILAGSCGAGCSDSLT